MEQPLHAFALKGTPVFCQRFGQGHINETYMTACDSGLCYIIQKINTAIFTQPARLMENIAAVTAFLAQRTEDPRGAMHLVPTVDGKSFYQAPDGGCWRAYDFVPGSLCLQSAQTPEDFYQSAVAFGSFQKTLADFPAETLHQTIANFHNTADRYRIFHEALSADKLGRAAACQLEIDFALAREQEAGTLVNLLAQGALPLRVTHNDTKLNNVLLDYDTKKPLCVIDLDTVMPGLSLYDFGDSIRFGAATAAEDETDLSKVTMSLALFRTYTQGFLSACGDSLTETEVQLLPMGAKLMTLECGVRFLTDYLEGDTYFRIHRAEHNLDRCRTQFKLVADMESKWAQMASIVAEAAQA